MQEIPFYHKGLIICGRERRVGMPELPDVEAMRQYLQDTSLHQEIAQVRVLAASVVKGSSPRDFSEALRGKSFAATGRHGKNLFVRLDDNRWITMHFGMTGGLAYFPETEEKPPYARVVFSFRNGHALAFADQRKFGKISFIPSPQDFIFSRHLAVDALDQKLDLPLFRKILALKRGTVKSVLMDQHGIAGIGNVYSDEILFQAGINPASPVSSLSGEQIGRLYAETKRVLEAAVLSGADPSRMPDGFLIPVRSLGAECPRSGDRLEMKKIAGRSSVFCPKCQPMP
jgi:formamidopyrimidine-DNA glycosylase